MEELRDIKGLVEVTDDSLYYLLGLMGLAVVVLLVLAALIHKYLTKKEPMTQRKVAMAFLDKFEFTETKESVYTFTHLAQYAVKENQRRELEALLAELDVYKFKKEVRELDDALKVRMKNFIEELRRG